MLFAFRWLIRRYPPTSVGYPLHIPWGFRWLLVDGYSFALGSMGDYLIVRVNSVHTDNRTGPVSACTI